VAHHVVVEAGLGLGLNTASNHDVKNLWVLSSVTELEIESVCWFV
jgi:hypothetical protein